MPGNGFSITNGARALLLAAAWAAAPLAAQSAGDYRLPEATTSPDPRTAGPVDPSHPSIGLPSPRPSAAPAPAPSPPVPRPSAAAPSSAPRAPAPVRTAPVAAPAVRAAPVAAPAPRPSTALPVPSVSPSISVLPSASDLPLIPPAAPAAQPAWESIDWRPWAGVGAALLLALFAVLWRRGRRPAETAAQVDPPEAPRPAAPLREPSPAADAGELALELTLEARRMTASLMATTLSYTLRLTNTGPAPLATLAVEGDLVSAHASLPVDQQIASDDLRLELRHAHVALAPGESIEFSGDLRLPLAEITPIRAGNAAYFVPLVRWRVEAAGPAPGSQVQVQTFVIGELPEQPGAALRPFRLDLGPRTYSRIGQRAVA